MDIRLKDKIAIVTGGGRGIGAAFCEALASAGAKVVVADVLDGTPVVERIESMQGKAIYCRADVTSKPSIERWWRRPNANLEAWISWSTTPACSPTWPKSPFRRSTTTSGIA
jgi:NAD(P)-dependent dehydrogenase (short-subunit alcohol dehydrogenase family)